MLKWACFSELSELKTSLLYLLLLSCNHLSVCMCVCRVKQVLGSLRSQLPVLSDSEKDMRKELQTVNDQLRHLDNGIKQVCLMQLVV